MSRVYTRRKTQRRVLNQVHGTSKGQVVGPGMAYSGSVKRLKRPALLRLRFIKRSKK